MLESDFADTESQSKPQPIAVTGAVIDTDFMLGLSSRDVTVFIVDDSALVRNRLAGQLNDIGGVMVVGAVGNLAAAICGNRHHKSRLCDS